MVRRKSVTKKRLSGPITYRSSKRRTICRSLNNSPLIKELTREFKQKKRSQPIVNDVNRQSQVKHCNIIDNNLNETIDLSGDENVNEFQATNLISPKDEPSEIIVVEDNAKDIVQKDISVVDISEDTDIDSISENMCQSNDDIVIIDSFAANPSTSSLKKPDFNTTSACNYIPLTIPKNTYITNNILQRYKINNLHLNSKLHIKSKKKKKKKKKLFNTLKETTNLSEFYNVQHNKNIIPNNSSVQNPGKNVSHSDPVNIPKSGLRPIIIDGNNVALGNILGHSKNLQFSSRRLEICINYFKERGHEVTAFVPQYRMKSKNNDNPELFRSLVNSGDVILTPSKYIQGKSIVPYDDRFIVQTAFLKGGIIVTRDSYQDLLAENPAWAETIIYRTLPHVWVDDILMFPKDPLGVRGPTLDEFLRFN